MVDTLDPQQPTIPPYTPPSVPPVKSPFGPLVLGFFAIIFVAGALAVAYYMSKFQAELKASPAPSVVVSPLPSPSMQSSATPSASTKPSIKPTSAIQFATSPTPTSTPFTPPTLDLRFGNPSANVKQTVDEGKGDGRVIYREYTSVQAGQFDEVPSSWSPKVTVCFHLVSNESIAGKLIKFSMLLDDKTEVEDTMSWIDMLEAGRIYDWCHDVTTSIGKHTAKITINADKSVKESNYANGLATLTWENLADNVAPNFTLVGPTNDVGKTCLTASYIGDNVTPTSSLKLERKVDVQDWEVTTSPTYCFSGTSGSEHSYGFRITDQRNNKTEATKTFNLF